MRIAFFSPLPPARSGIADYSAALLEPLSRLAEVETFAERPAHFNPRDWDVCVYQLGNNPYHVVPYEMALEHPGVSVVHEANLHHLITELTIRRNDWPAYLREVEFDGGAEAHEYARRHVATLERGPDYSGVPMLKRVAGRSRGVVVHSDFVGAEVRKTGYAGPLTRIWHGGWLATTRRPEFRTRLGIDERTPLVGTFGFLKPYKRIAESLRAFRRLLRMVPTARMILVGEPHPELPLSAMIDALGLAHAVRVLGFIAESDFDGFIGACDVVLNLRYPTVGESSGTLLRALGLGRPTIVSDVGSFSEYPDNVVLKVPIGSAEEDTLFEYLNLLVSRPAFAEQLGTAARSWVERECSWKRVAEQYVGFLDRVLKGLPEPVPQPAEPAPAQVAVEPAPAPTASLAEAEVLSWTTPEARSYAETHITRLGRTLEITPRGGPDDRVLEMGAYLQITPALHYQLGYGDVRGCYYGKAGRVDHRTVQSEDGRAFECDIDLFDAEKDAFPYPDGHFATVLCCELIEHLTADPMHMMSEINRILRPGGHLVLTTPNICSLRAISALLAGYQPGFFPAYIRPREDGETDARHNREYTPLEIDQLLTNSGFETTLIDTGPFLDEPHPEFAWIPHMLDRYMLPAGHRGDGIYAVGRKTGSVCERYPAWLYS